MDGAGTQQHIVIAGAGYAGLHVALRLAARLGRRDVAELTLVDQHDYHQVLTELPRVAAGTRQAEAVRIPFEQVLAQSVKFIQTTITGVDLAGRRLLTEVGPLPYTRLVLALGSRPNDFAIPGLAERTLCLYSVADAGRVWTAVNAAVQAAAKDRDPARQRRLLTAVIGGGGPPEWSWPGNWRKRCPSWHAVRASRPTCRRWCWWKPGAPSWRGRPRT